MAATERGAPLAALLHAACALPILALTTRAGAAQGEVGFNLLGYRERGLMKVSEPLLWGRLRLSDAWEVEATAAVDIVTGASPQAVSNLGGMPVQTVTGASVSDRRRAGRVRATRRFAGWTLSGSTAWSGEDDYRSRALAVDATRDLAGGATTLAAGFGASRDTVGSSLDPGFHAPRRTREYLLGVTQLLSPLAVVQSTLTATRGHGDYDDPYKFTLSVLPGSELPVFVPDRRPDHRATLAWLTRLRRHFPALDGTLQAEYRYFRDDWGVRAHALELAWSQSLGARWTLRPALRYYTQGAADFYAPVAPVAQPAVLSSDARLGAFGGVTPSLRVALRLDDGLLLEATAGYVVDAAWLRPGGGSAAFTTLRAYYGLLGLSRSF